jgi:hypothetical protein
MVSHAFELLRHLDGLIEGCFFSGTRLRLQSSGSGLDGFLKLRVFALVFF